MLRMGHQSLQARITSRHQQVNKKQLIARVQRYMGPGATGSTASAAVEAVLTSIQKAANTNPKLHIAGFGTFRISPKGKLTFSPARGFLPGDK